MHRRRRGEQSNNSFSEIGPPGHRSHSFCLLSFAFYQPRAWDPLAVGDGGGERGLAWPVADLRRPYGAVLLISAAWMSRLVGAAETAASAHAGFRSISARHRPCYPGFAHSARCRYSPRIFHSRNGIRLCAAALSILGRLSGLRPAASNSPACNDLDSWLHRSPIMVANDALVSPRCACPCILGHVSSCVGRAGRDQRGPRHSCSSATR